MKKLLLFLLMISPLFCWGQDSLKVMWYNLYRFPVNPPANREYLLQDIINYVHPDLLMACEIVDEDGSNRILHTSFADLPDSFAAPQFVPCTTCGQDPLQQMAYYNTRKLTLIHQKALHTIIRDINHYTFYLNTSVVSGDTSFLDVFVTHLKAGDGSSNAFLRETMADTFVKALYNVPQDHYVLLAGDFNFYNSQEPAYGIMTDTTNPIVMVDPLNRPGDWHNNPTFRKIQTQATRKILSGFGLGGASGGMDDRFDFILMSKNLRTDSNLHFLSGSYKVVGNNGDCFNRRIDNDTCVGVYPLAFRHVLFQMSDHAPVVMTLISRQPFPTAIPPTHPDQKSQIIFPDGNAVHQQLLFRINDKAIHSGNFLTVYDMSGKILKKIKITRFGTTLSFDVSKLTAGLYFMRYRQSSKRFFKY